MEYAPIQRLWVFSAVWGALERGLGLGRRCCLQKRLDARTLWHMRRSLPGSGGQQANNKHQRAHRIFNHAVQCVAAWFNGKGALGEHDRKRTAVGPCNSRLTPGCLSRTGVYCLNWLSNDLLTNGHNRAKQCKPSAETPASGNLGQVGSHNLHSGSTRQHQHSVPLALGLAAIPKAATVASVLAVAAALRERCMGRGV